MLSNKGDNERRIVCPYDPAHVLLHYRMQTHLVKCRRNHPTDKMATCINNSTHHVPEPELKYHYEVCSDRSNTDKFYFATDKMNPNRFPIPELNVQATENWDDEVHPTYDPIEHCKNSLVLRNSVIHTQSAAVRRTFRMEERERIRGLMDQQNIKPNGHNEQETQKRRPVGASEGLQNRAEVVENAPFDNAPFDISNLLEKVNLGSSTLTTPRLTTPDAVENEEEDSKEAELISTKTEPAPRVQYPGNGNEVWGPKKSTGAIPRTYNSSNGNNETEEANRSTGAIPRTQNYLSEEQFPQLGASRAANNGNRQPRAGANFPSRPISRGRGSQLAKK